MSTLLLVGIVMAGLPLLLMMGFAGFIFWGFVSDDKDARNVVNVALAIMAIGVLLIIGHFVGSAVSVTP